MQQDIFSHTLDARIRRKSRDPAGSQFAKCSIPRRNSMAFKPNYGMQRTDRNRVAQARSEQKQRKREKKSAQCKAERIVEIKISPDAEKAK